MSVHYGQSGGSRHVPVLGSKARAPLRAPVAAPLAPPRHFDLPPPPSVPGSVKPPRKRRSRAGRTLCLVGFAAALTALAAGFLSRLYLSLDVFSNFTPQLAVAAVAFLIAAFLPGMRLTFAGVLILGGIAGMGIFARHESDRIAALPAVCGGSRREPAQAHVVQCAAVQPGLERRGKRGRAAGPRCGGADRVRGRQAAGGRSPGSPLSLPGRVHGDSPTVTCCFCRRYRSPPSMCGGPGRVRR